MDIRRLRALGVAATAAALAAVGCAFNSPAPAPPRGSACRDRVASFSPQPVGKLTNVVFVLDSSAGMERSHAALRAALPRFVDGLMAGDPTPEDPASGDERAPLDQLRIGVLTGDLGALGDRTQECDVLGDDGLFSAPFAVSSGGRPPRCQGAASPGFVEFFRGDSAPQRTAELACLATVGAGGCTTQQPLEAVLRALWPPPGASLDDDPPDGAGGTAPFLLGRAGNAPEHAGFAPGGSTLAVVVLTRGDDCSVRDPELLDASSPFYAGAPVSLRCASAPIGFAEQGLWPVSRLVEGLVGGRDPVRGRLVFQVIAGVPPDARAVANTTELTFGPARANTLDALLRLPSMEPRVSVDDPAWTCTSDVDCAARDVGLRCRDGRCVRDTPRLAASCVGPLGDATPPRRLVSAARALIQRGARALVHSVCEDSFDRALSALASELLDAQQESCFPRAETAVGSPVCRLRLALQPGQRCETLGIDGISPTPAIPPEDDPIAGGESCEVRQFPPLEVGQTPPRDNGWYFDAVSERTRLQCGAFREPLRLVLTRDGVWLPNDNLTLDCCD